MDLRTAYHIVPTSIRMRPASDRVIGLEPLPYIGAEGQIGFGIAGRERNVFQRVVRLLLDTGIGENRPILLPSVDEGSSDARALEPNRHRRYQRMLYRRREEAWSRLLRAQFLGRSENAVQAPYFPTVECISAI